jgi:hypothetical protein
MEIKVTIEVDSKLAEAIKRHMAEKKAFRDAVTTGNVHSYVQQNKMKFDLPVNLDIQN